MKRRAVFLDRDGVLNEKAPEGEYIRSWAEFRFLPGVPEALLRLQALGYLLIVVTNQRGVARGLMTTAQVEDIHDRMIAALAEHGVHLDAVYYCPHESGQCLCRKPAPGMLLRARSDFPDLLLEESWMVGDSLSDIEAGTAAGCHTIFLVRGARVQEVVSEAVQRGLRPTGTAGSLTVAVDEYFIPTVRE